jgi:PAS domain S-box-containing protein
MKRKNGTVFWCHLSGRAVDPKRLEEGLIWATQDITERREAEEALREGEQRLKRLLKNSNDIIAITNGNGVLISVSGASKTMLGFEPEGLVGQKTFDYVHPDDLALARKTFADALANPGITQRGEFRLRHRNGDWIEVEALGTSWAHDSGIAENVMNIRNISERKSAERERAKLQGQLQQAMKMEAVGRLAGGIAHDFNNLLTVIGGNVELARRDLDPSDPLAHYLVEVSKAAASAASLTGQLLAFSRRRIIVPRVLNPNDLIENLRKMLGRIVGEDIALQTNLAEELGAVKVDPGQFDQVVVNLAVNARDAMPEGGRLTIETANCDLDEAYCRQHADVSPGRYVMIAVSDTGQGMDAEVRRRLFEPFFTTKPVGRGTGLGLAMIFGAVKQSGGTIDVHSEVGQGTTFKIYLPRIEAPAEKLAVVPLSLDLPGGSETVLLVEDEASVRGLISSVLKRLGYKVLVAANGGEAFMLTEKYTGGIDLMMTDVVMPGMNGRELAERLRQFKPEMEVLFTSGYTESVIVHNAVVDERLNFIGKPYSMQGIARKIREVIEARKGRDRR